MGCEKNSILIKFSWHSYLILSLSDYAMNLCTQSGLRATPMYLDQVVHMDGAHAKWSLVINMFTVLEMKAGSMLDSILSKS